MAGLSITPATTDQAQAVTQNPQSVPAAQTIGGASAQSGGVQPGTSKSLLTSDNGVALRPTALTTVNVNVDTAGQTSASSAQPATVKNHHVNPALLIISVAFVVLAIGFFWAISRSAKSTTNYS